MENFSFSLKKYFLLGFALFLACFSASAQDEEDTSGKDLRPVRNTFESIWLIDNQSVMVPIKGTFEFDIQHRFGTLENGYDDFFGLYAPSNIRLGFMYTPINRLQLGFGITKSNVTWDFNAKYALLQQARVGGSPLSITYFVSGAVDSRPKENFVRSGDRISYFHQLIFARKFNDNFSLQIAPSISHLNAVAAFRNDKDEVVAEYNHDHIAISIGCRYKITETLGVIFNHDLPITEHDYLDPKSNTSFGIEVNSSSHTFQFFFGKNYLILPQQNNFFNNKEDFLLGFNMTRLWNF